jgi:hypothetical protein
LRWVAAEKLPRAIVEQIIERADGVPLFIEELTKAAVESGPVVDAGDRFSRPEAVAALEIPTTLHASLLARLDRLGQAREAAQVGAALGRRFSHQLISSVAAMPPRDLDDALAQLLTVPTRHRAPPVPSPWPRPDIPREPTLDERRDRWREGSDDGVYCGCVYHYHMIECRDRNRNRRGPR